MSNLSKTDRRFSKAYKDCFENRTKLSDTISEVDYSLSDSPDRAITLDDIFLEKNGDLGMQCATLLVQQVKYQYELLIRISYNVDDDDISRLQSSLLDELTGCAADVDCLKYLLSNDITNHELRRYEQDGAIQIYFLASNTAMNCQSLVNFADKLLQSITENVKSHQQDCKLERCFRCGSWEELQECTKPLLEGLFESSNTDIYSPDGWQKSETVAKSLKDIDLSSNNAESEEAANLSFNEQAGATLQEEYTYIQFKRIVLNKHKDLQKYYERYHAILQDNELPVVILYTAITAEPATETVIKVVHCATIHDARVQANSLQDISKDTFQVVLITKTDHEFPNMESRKRMFQKVGKVGQEVSPFLVGNLRTPLGREPGFETPMVFFLDTGADTGSVGYNFNIIKRFILTVEKINKSCEPAILCNFNTDNITEDEIQVFDVDEDPNWNAIGLAFLKKYRIYLDIQENRVEIGLHDDVIVEDSAETVMVIFKKNIVPEQPEPSPFQTTNMDDL